jgi:hypothetical protein
VEVLPKDLCEGCARGSFIVDDEDGRFVSGRSRHEEGEHWSSCRP